MRVIVMIALLFTITLSCQTAPTVTPQPTATLQPTATPTPMPQRAFEDGYHRVGVDIAPGSYWLEMATPSPGRPVFLDNMTVEEVLEALIGTGSPICSWIILNDVKPLEEVTRELAVAFDQFQGYSDTYVVTIDLEDKVFSSETCGTWRPLAERLAQLDEQERERLDQKWEEWKKLNNQKEQ